MDGGFDLTDPPNVDPTIAEGMATIFCSSLAGGHSPSIPAKESSRLISLIYQGENRLRKTSRCYAARHRVPFAMNLAYRRFLIPIGAAAHA